MSAIIYVSYRSYVYEPEVEGRVIYNQQLPVTWPSFLNMPHWDELMWEVRFWGLYILWIFDRMERVKKVYEKFGIDETAEGLDCV